MTFKLQPRLMLAMAASSLLSVLIVMVIAIQLGTQVVEQDIERKIQETLNARHAALSEYLLHFRRDAHLLARDPLLAEALRDFTQAFAQQGKKAQLQLQQAWISRNPYPAAQRQELTERNDGSAYDRVHARHHPLLREKLRAWGWEDLFLVDPGGNVVYSIHKKTDFATNLREGPWKNTGLASAVRPLLDKPIADVGSYAGLSDYPPSAGPARFYALPVLNQSDGFLGVVVIQLSLARFNQIMQDKEGRGQSGESFMVGPDGWMLTDSRFEESSTVLRKRLKTEAVTRVLAGETGLIQADDYRGVPSYIAFRPIQTYPDAIGGNIRWGVISKMDRAEALAAMSTLRNTLLGAGLLIALLAVAAGLKMARTVSQPIIAIQAALKRLVQGEATTVPGLERQDEIGEMARSAETFREKAEKIERDHLVQENVNILTSLVSGETRMAKAAERLLHRLCEMLDVPVAAIYLGNGQGRFAGVGSHGLARRSQAENGFGTGEGLLGQCARDQQAIVLSPVPAGLMIISSGLLEFPPHELVIYPICHKNEALVILELAAARSLEPGQHEFLRVACAALGLHFANLQVSEHNLALLEETRRQSDELHAKALYTRSLIEASQDPLVTISAEGKITDVNSATEKATGVDRQHLIGSDFADYFTDPDEARRGYQRIFAEGAVLDYPLAIRHVSGKVTDVLYNAAVYRDDTGQVRGAFAAARDITARKLVEAALAQKQEALRLNNEEMKALNEELRSQAEEMKVQNEELRASQEALRAQQEEMAHKNLALEAQSRELELARQEAESKASELQQASQYKSEFLANMSHELRTPLNSILILAQDLATNAEGNLLPDQVESASVIHESGSQLLTLINDILDLSKIEANRLEVLNETLSLDEVLSYLRRVFAPLAEQKGIDFRLEIDETAPESLQGDRQRLTQILTNLLSNAVKFTASGEVVLAVKRHDGQIVFDVRDTGIGIPADKIEHIFGVFQQLDGTTSRKYGGSGLGLAITRRLVDLMGGTLQVTSTPGIGSCFSVRLPERTAAEAQPAAPAVPPAPQHPLTHTRRAPTDAGILVVEDDKRLTRILQRLIDTLGFAASCVDSGEAALQYLATQRPAGILLDLGLPGISGMEVLRRLKADPTHASIPVFIMSGASDTGEASTLGAVGFLKKPVTRDMIASALQTMHRLSAEVARKQVLLVEDDAATVMAVTKLFHGDPVELTPCSTGKMAHAALQDKGFDAVILDLGLEDMSGFEWLAQLEEQGIQRPPVVVYSARDLNQDELLQLRAYTDVVVIKGSHASARLRDEVLLAVNAPPAPPPTPALSPGGKGDYHLLLVDDDVRNLFALSKALRARGKLRVTVAETGARALELLRQDHFDAVLTDIMMPEMDGYELTRQIRALGYQDLPIIAVTAKAMQGDGELCLQAGANAYVPKPVDIDQLMGVLQQWL